MKCKSIINIIPCKQFDRHGNFKDIASWHSRGYSIAVTCVSDKTKIIQFQGDNDSWQINYVICWDFQKHFCDRSTFSLFQFQRKQILSILTLIRMDYLEKHRWYYVNYCTYVQRKWEGLSDIQYLMTRVICR